MSFSISAKGKTREDAVQDLLDQLKAEAPSNSIEAKVLKPIAEQYLALTRDAGETESYRVSLGVTLAEIQVTFKVTAFVVPDEA